MMMMITPSELEVELLYGLYESVTDTSTRIIESLLSSSKQHKSNVSAFLHFYLGILWPITILPPSSPLGTGPEFWKVYIFTQADY